MTQKKIKWTPQQNRAVEEHSRSVFVSASAGTGKTAVLSGSCVHIIQNRSACPDVWNILVVTFTDMAAEQMRSRIASQLNSAVEAAKDPGLRSHLRHQLILLGAADISTVHSFCKRLITEHFHALALDPTFAVLDADESKLLKAEVLEKTIDWAWQQQNLAQPLRQLLTKRDLRLTDGFPAKIIDISDFLDGAVSRNDWLERAKTLAEAIDPFTTDLAQSQKQIITEKLQNALSRIQAAQKIYLAQNPSGRWSAKCEQNYIAPVADCIEKLNRGDWEAGSSAIIDFEKPRVYKPKDVSQTLAESIGKMVSVALDSVKELKDLAVLNPEYLDKFAGAVGSQTRVLVELLKRFDYLYSQAKKAINCLDFADLEHYALRLLTSEEADDDKLTPSKTALALRGKYKYVFVDEYQDINSVQQAILDMVASPGNVFAVGDVKQSIYQWRGARPEIFLENLKMASDKPAAPGLGLRVDLNTNFRSVKGILDFVNEVFSWIMTASFSNIDYDESAMLKPSPQNDTEHTISPVELHILDKPQLPGAGDEQPENEDQSPQPFSSRQLQATLIAQRIKQIVGENDKPEMQIIDKQTSQSRPVEYRDIVVLMRSLAGRNDFVEALRLAGIPVSCETTAGYFEATEITDMLSLLKVLDNPRRDIEFAAVLRSPFFGLTDTELAKIRLHAKAGNGKPGFYDCAVEFCRLADDRELADKLANAIAALDDWRTLARRGRLAELIWKIYRKTGFISFVSALPDGPARRANLLKLHDRAIQFESFAGNLGVPSLTRFIVFIEKFLATGQDWAPAEPESAAGDAVRILSVHKSKGLEFPVVFVADIDSQFSKKDSKQDCLVDENSTLGLRIIDPDTNTRLDSLAYQVIEQRARRKSLAEEMRILYVAMTRAMNRLILVGCKDKRSCQNIVAAAHSFIGRPIPHWHLESCKSHLEWLLCALANQPLLHEALQTDLKPASTGDNLFSVKLYDQNDLIQLAGRLQNAKTPQISRKTKLKTKHSKLKTQNSVHLRQSLDWRYPFGDIPLLPAKRSVTQWTHRNDEFVKIDYSTSLGRKPKSLLDADKTDAVDGRAIGTATHLVISKLDLAEPPTVESIQSLIHKLVADEAIAESVASKVDAESIVSFFESEIGRLALDKNHAIHREWPFTFAFPASDWLEPSTHQTGHERRVTGDDTIIVQGIIDLLIETPVGLVLIDFKTDDVTADRATQRAELYRTQLELYARAASAITGRKVLSKWLYFLRPARQIEV